MAVMSNKKATDLFLQLQSNLRQLNQVLAATMEGLHDNAKTPSPSLRAFLEQIVADGKATVPEIARQRGVSRQHVQKLADLALSNNWVKVEPNPRHLRSPFYQLTAPGKKVIEGMANREKAFLDQQKWPVSQKDLAEASRICQALIGHCSK
jgi:DNA-binding MarR family transcriptional regulator